MVTILNTSNPAALGARWTSDDGSTFELAVARGTSSVMFGILPAGSTRWMTPTRVVRPQRFGAIPTSAKQMVAFARRFVDYDNERPAEDD